MKTFIESIKKKSIQSKKDARDKESARYRITKVQKIL